MDKQIETQLLENSKIFFDSIEAHLVYREKNIWKYNLTSFLRGIIYIMTAMTVIPLFPFQNRFFLTKLLGTSVILFGFDLSMGNFYLRWLASLLLLAPLIILANIVRGYFKRKQVKYSITEKQLNFAYLAISLKELKLFLVNERHDCITQALKYLYRYYEQSDTFLPINNTNERISLSALLGLKQSKFWVQYSDEMENVMKVISSFQSKILDRVAEKEDIDKVVQWLEYLLIYEYSRVKKPKADGPLTNESDVIQAGYLSFYKFCEFVNNASEYEYYYQENNKTVVSFFKKFTIIFEKISRLFTSRYLVVTFISWLSLLSIICITAVHQGIRYFQIKFDSTIFIGVLTCIIATAATIAVTIDRKKK